MVKTVLIAVLLCLAAASFGRVMKKSHLTYEERGSGLTDQEADFIKARILEVQKKQVRVDQSAFLIQQTLGPLGGTWGVLISEAEEERDCDVGFEIGDPFQDKWIQMNEFGSIPDWIYAIWKAGPQ